MPIVSDPKHADRYQQQPARGVPVSDRAACYHADHGAAPPIPTLRLPVALPRPLARADLATRRDALLQLQQVHGNAFVSRLIVTTERAVGPGPMPGSTPPLVVQRIGGVLAGVTAGDLNDEEQAAWQESGGPGMISLVRADADAWAAFWANPRDERKMPGKAAYRAAKAFVQAFVASQAGKAGNLTEEDLPPRLKDFVSGQLGPIRLAYLSQMTVLNLSCKGGYLGYLFNLDTQGVGKEADPHRYTVEVDGIPAPGSIRDRESLLRLIKNVLPMTTTLEVAYSNGFGWGWHKTYGLNGLMYEASKAREIIKYLVGKKLDSKLGNKTADPVGGGVAGLKVEVSGTTSTVGYWGIDNLEGRASYGSGLGLLLYGPAGFELPALGFKDAAGLGAAGVGYVTGRIGAKDEAIDKPGSLTLPVEKATKTFRRSVTGFATQSAVVTPRGLDDIWELQKEIAAWTAKQTAHLAALGVEPGWAEPNFDIEITGWASPSWRGAKTQGEREGNNQKLSEERAAAVHDQVAKYLTAKTIVSVGNGARKTADITQDDPFERRVDILVTWTGELLKADVAAR